MKKPGLLLALIAGFFIFGLIFKNTVISTDNTSSSPESSSPPTAASSAETVTTVPSAETTASPTTAAPVTTAAVTTTSPPETTTHAVYSGINTNDEVYSEYTFSDTYNGFLADCVFIGDSICSGLDRYDILPDDNVLAEGNVSAFNIEGFTFTYHGYDMPLSEALADRNPRYVVFSMGMNDVNMGSSELYVQNYERLLNEVEEVLPGAVLIINSITPIYTSSNFCSNSKIDTYNNAMRDYAATRPNTYFADTSPLLKGGDNGLKDGYSSGDGIHLSRSAYHAMLYQLCRQIVDRGLYP